jgi:hypothetical protein
MLCERLHVHVQPRSCAPRALFNKGLFHGVFQAGLHLSTETDCHLWLGLMDGCSIKCPVCVLQVATSIHAAVVQQTATPYDHVCVPRSKCVVLQRQVFVRCEVW